LNSNASKVLTLGENEEPARTKRERERESEEAKKVEAQKVVDSLRTEFCRRIIEAIEKARDRDFPLSLWPLKCALDGSARTQEEEIAALLALAAVEYTTRGHYPKRLDKDSLLGAGLRRGFEDAVNCLRSQDYYGPKSVKEEGWFIIVSLD
jgi:hypothetical protein